MAAADPLRVLRCWETDLLAEGRVAPGREGIFIFFVESWLGRCPHGGRGLPIASRRRQGMPLR